jgi:hypothetical protein
MLDDNPASEKPLTPLEKVEALYAELVEHYGQGEDREIRAAAKILLVALAKFKEYGGADWQTLLDEYVLMLKGDPEKFERVIKGNRSQADDHLLA